MAKVNIPLDISIPPMPNTLFVTALKPETLDAAFGVKGFSVSVGELDSTTIEDVITAWGESFRNHCQTIREANKNKPGIR